MQIATKAINDLMLVFQDWIDYGTPLTTTSDEASKLYDAVLTQVSRSTSQQKKKNNILMLPNLKKQDIIGLELLVLIVTFNNCYTIL